MHSKDCAPGTATVCRGRSPCFWFRTKKWAATSSRRITESLARKSEAVLVLEPSYGLKGAVKTARKGVGEYTIKVTGKAAHSGLDFEKGESAIVELAKQITAISQAGRPEARPHLERGPGLRRHPDERDSRAGHRFSRCSRGAHERRGRHRSPTPGAQTLQSQMQAGNQRRRQSSADGTQRRRGHAVQESWEIAKQLGWKLEEASVGGGSDGNFTASLGIPTLDGLGGVGEGAHATHESIIISELPRRAALLAGLIETA